MKSATKLFAVLCLMSAFTGMAIAGEVKHEPSTDPVIGAYEATSSVTHTIEASTCIATTAGSDASGKSDRSDLNGYDAVATRTDLLNVGNGSAPGSHASDGLAWHLGLMPAPLPLQTASTMYPAISAGAPAAASEHRNTRSWRIARRQMLRFS